MESQIVTSPLPLGGGKVRAPKAFTEKGLYMLATILNSPKAVGTILGIIEAFANLIYNLIKKLGLSYITPRPSHHKKDISTHDAFKKTSRKGKK